MVDAEWLRASCEDVGDLMHRAGPIDKSEPSVPESVFQILRLLPTDSERGEVKRI